MWRGPFAYGHAGATRIRWGRDIESSVDGRFRRSHLTSGVRVSRPSAPEEGSTEQREQRGGGEDPRGSLGRASDPSAPRSWIWRLRFRRRADGLCRGDARRDCSTSDRRRAVRMRPTLACRTSVLRHDAIAPGRPGTVARGRSSTGARGSRLRGSNATRSLSPQRGRFGPVRLRDRGHGKRWGMRGAWRLVSLRFILLACHGSLARTRYGRRRCRRDSSARRCRRRLRRRRGGSQRQQRQGIDIALGIIGAPDPQVDVWNVELHVARRPDRSDRLGLGDSVAFARHDRPEMKQRYGISIRRPDRHRTAVPGQPAGERHLPRGRRADGGAGVTADVDPAVTVLVVLGPTEVETTQHGPVRRPAPSRGRRRCDQYQRDQHQGGRCLSRQHRRRT
jgi:hypothetical protein